MQERDPIPENFASIEEAAEFWETHSLADYWDMTKEVHFAVRKTGSLCCSINGKGPRVKVTKLLRRRFDGNPRCYHIATRIG